MDISHVASVELPLNVKNPEKAIELLGGKERIKKAINSQYRPMAIQSSSHSVDDNNLELRLRKDPFHHPIQATVNKREKILLKVSIPKSGLPADYKENRTKYTVKELLQENYKKHGPNHKVEPIAIINKNYSFRAMADFQMSTKNNKTAQHFNKNIINVHKYDDVRKYYEEELVIKNEFRNPEVFENKDHHLIPPPHFSGVKFPFDYRYQKSPYTVTIRDESGNVKVVMKSDTKKLFTNTVDYYGESVPLQPLPEIVKKYEWLLQADLSQEYADRKLLDCIHFLRGLFEIKPMWLRKSLVDVTPEPLKGAVKEALPYLLYCFKNGPWRFCNVKLGLNPKDDREFWVYQSGYFRLQGLRTKHDHKEDSNKVVPRTIATKDPSSDVKVSEHLLFTGDKLPRAINYQIGDIMDPDILKVISQAEKEGTLLRDSVDSQDGWVSKQVLETIRRIVRYKLRRLYLEEPIEKDQVAKIIEMDYTDKFKDLALENDDVDSSEDEEEEEEEDDDDEEREDDGDDDDLDEKNTSRDTSGASDNGKKTADVLGQIKQVDSGTAEKLKQFVDLVKQDDIE